MERLLKKSQSIHVRAMLAAFAFTGILLTASYLMPWRFPPIH